MQNERAQSGCDLLHAKAFQHNWKPKPDRHAASAIRSGRAGKIADRFAPANTPANPPATNCHNIVPL
jgi:hypothetical protein